MLTGQGWLGIVKSFLVRLIRFRTASRSRIKIPIKMVVILILATCHADAEPCESLLLFMTEHE